MKTKCMMNKSLRMIIFMIVTSVIFASSGFCASARYFDSNNIGQAPIGAGLTFYVDGVNGSDSWNGRSSIYTTGTTGPFKTISKAVDRYAGRNVGGNTVLVKSGTYRERVSIGNVTGATSESTRFVLGSYGDGPVTIDATNTSSLTWSAFSGNNQIYVADFALTLGGAAASPQAVVMDDNFKACRPVQSLDLLTSFGKWFYDSTAKKIYVYTGGVDPTTRNILVTKRDPNNVDYGVYITGNYVTIYGLTVVGASSYGIHAISDSHTRVQNCDVKYSGKAGIKLYGNYGELLKNHVHGNVLLNWPRGSTWDTSGGWPNGMTGSSYALISGNIVHDNGGEGIGSMAGAGGLIIEDNISHDNWSVNIYLDNQPNDIVRRNLVYNSAFHPEDAMDASMVPAWTTLGKVWKRLFPEGIITGDETASGAIAKSTNHQIYDNLIINCYTGYSHYGQATGAGLRNFIIANNTIVMPDFTAPYGSFTGINLGHYAASTNTIVKNNIVYGTNHGVLVSLGSATDAGVLMDNNLYFDTGALSPFITGSYPSAVTWTFAAWKMATGQDNMSMFADPLFATGADVFNSDYYVPTASSPAISMGSIQTGYTSDFNSLTKSTPWTVGAFEYGSVNGDITASSVTPPTLTSFSIPVTSSSLTVSITSFTASDNIGVTGYLISESATTPAPNALGWSSSPPNSFCFCNSGDRTAYAWAKNAAGIVSNSMSASVTIMLPDTTTPNITAFTMQTTATSLTVTISSFNANDNIGVTGYLISESSSFPLIDDSRWSEYAPSSFTFSNAGSKMVYAWVKDAAGNLSNGVGRSVTINLPDTTAPVVSSFSMSTLASSSTVSISSFTATDNVAVTGYLVTESSTAPSSGTAGWSASAPTSFTFSSAGSKTAYAWVRDAAGNVSSSRSASVTISLPDITAPVVSSFKMPSSASSKTVAISSFTATDNVRVIGYLITESATKPAVGASGWSASAPTSFTFSSAGRKTAYAWAKDAAGNISSMRSATVNISTITIKVRRK